MRSLTNYLIFVVGSGLIGFALLFGGASEEGNRLLFGLSAARLAVAGVTLLLLLLGARLAWLSLKRPRRIRSGYRRLSRLLGARTVFWLLGGASAFFLLILFTFGVLATPAIAQSFGWLPAVFGRVRSLAGWLGLSSLGAAILLYSVYRDEIKAHWPAGKWVVWLALAAAGSLFLAAGYAFLRYFQADYALLQCVRDLFILALLVCTWIGLGVGFSQAPAVWEKLQRTLLPVLMFAGFFLFYHATAAAIGHTLTPSKSYFDQLAYAFLDGRLYLENPSSTMDLTLYNGQWYVAFPPLAALLMLPLALMNGARGFSTVTFSIFFAALNAPLAYAMLQELARRGWTRLRAADNFWLTVLLALGTIHYSIGISGKVWHVSRLLALTFMLAAVVLTLKRKSPWWIGLAIGLAIGARPNIAFMLPFLLGIHWQDLQEGGTFQFKKLAGWVAAMGVPIGLAVLGLLYYNWLRFGNFLDFGYATMNVGVNTEALETYGQFNSAYIPFNLYYMWVSLPYVSDSCAYRMVPNPQGISMLITTPAMIYLLRALRKSAWVIGAWAALLLQIALLSLHTGYAWEFGYRFLLDFIIPVVALIALAAGRRVSLLMRVLILAGVVVNLWGVLWFFDVWCFRL